MQNPFVLACGRLWYWITVVALGVEAGPYRPPHRTVGSQYQSIQVGVSGKSTYSSLA